MRATPVKGKVFDMKEFYKTDAMGRLDATAGNGELSLAQTLKMRREFSEKMELERKTLGLTGTPKFRFMPKQTDEAGSAIRIRP